MSDTLQCETFGSGMPLVFIHGWGLNSAIFKPVADKLASRYQVTLIDLPGFGDNQHIAPSEYSLSVISNLVADCITQPSVILGWSLGGLVATEIALHHRNLVTGLVTIASSPYFVQQDNWPGIKAELLTSFHRQLAADSDKTISNFLKLQAMGSEHVARDIKEIKSLLASRPKANERVLDASLCLLETVDLRCKIADLTVPFLRLYGRLDSLVPKGMIEQMDKLVPNADRYVFHRASHAPFISHKEEFYTVLSDWLNGIQDGQR
ncbi:pimeloyl-ACP methyl ester esterase BioH [Thalassotalea ponticola]|uniref:pimeloyl-ACP methyl ester esterase BioH n=1 Tax=Thalassotalea ponticola TaxID=1523392 RepID=UPI0025B2D11E|nr:pimeloyl-ACP methyl ester esterase BioH [Thalassotalea ponticola]MDN3652298.1 pimeloyl-ACP methyl ester esterase BioH [Thalassotalea ponticola]